MRRSLWIDLYKKPEPFESEHSKQLVSPIAAIIRLWLPVGDENSMSQPSGFNMAKRWLRYPIDWAIVSAFEILKFGWKGNAGGPVRREIQSLCWSILKALPTDAIVPEKARMWAESSWKEAGGEFVRGEMGYSRPNLLR